MSRQGVLERVLAGGVVGILRIHVAHDLVQVARAIRDGGISSIEVTMTCPGALAAIEMVASEMEGMAVGAGTILDAATARHAILSGAQFLVTPVVRSDVIETAHRYGAAVICGAMTPTEILTAWELGADLVKVFPAETLGPAFLKAVRGPLPQVPLVPTGGITAENAGDFVRAGAVLVGASSWLASDKDVAEGRYDAIRGRARRLADAVHTARKESTR